MICSTTRPALRDRDRLLGQLEHLARLALQHQQLARLALKPAAGPAWELETLGGTLGPPTSLGKAVKLDQLSTDRGWSLSQQRR